MRPSTGATTSWRTPRTSIQPSTSPCAHARTHGRARAGARSSPPPVTSRCRRCGTAELDRRGADGVRRHGARGSLIAGRSARDAWPSCAARRTRMCQSPWRTSSSPSVAHGEPRDDRGQDLVRDTTPAPRASRRRWPAHPRSRRGAGAGIPGRSSPAGARRGSRHAPVTPPRGAAAAPGPALSSSAGWARSRRSRRGRHDLAAVGAPAARAGGRSCPAAPAPRSPAQARWTPPGPSGGSVRGAPPAAPPRPGRPAGRGAARWRRERPRGPLRVGVGTVARLGDDLVDDAQLVLVGRRQAHRHRGVLGRLGGPPQDARAALGGDDGVDRVLERQHDVARPRWRARRPSHPRP